MLLFGSYFKGDDYITVTFINIHLQNFINKHFDRLPVTDAAKVCTDGLHGLIALSNERIVDEEIFKPLIVCLCGKCFKRDYKLVLQKITENVFFDQVMKKLLDIEPKTRYTDHLIKLLKTNTNLFKKSVMSPVSVFIKTYYKIISEYISSYFNVDEQSIVKIGNKTNYISSATFNMDLYEVEIYKKNDSNIRYKVIYTIYTYSQGNVTNAKYNAILNIVPYEAKITQNGLYDKIVYAGVYICKVVEYQSQCHIKHIRECKIRHIPDTQYAFIGDLMNNVWPLNLVAKNNTPLITSI